MKHTNVRKSKPKTSTALYFILPPTISANSKLRITLYAILGLILIFPLTSYIGNSTTTKIGIVLEMLSFLFVSPELFGINDISAIQNRVLALTERGAQHTLNIFSMATKNGVPKRVANIFYWLAWPQSKIYLSLNDDVMPTPYDWINSVEKSIPIAIINLFLLWLPGILSFVKCIANGISFFNSAYPPQMIILEPLKFLIDILGLFILGSVFSYFAISQTLATITWHLNAIATFLQENHERRLLAILGVWLFIFGSFLQFFAA